VIRLALAACLAVGCGKKSSGRAPVAGPPAKIGQFDVTDSGGKDAVVLSLVDANGYPVAFRGVAEVVVTQGALERCRQRLPVAYEGLRPGGPFTVEVSTDLGCSPPAAGELSATVKLTLEDGREFTADDGYVELLMDRLAQHMATTAASPSPAVAVAVDVTPVTDHDVAKTIIDRYLASLDAILAASAAAGAEVRGCPAPLRAAVKEVLTPQIAAADHDALAALRGGAPADPTFAWMSPTEHALRKHLDGDASQDVLELATYLKQRPRYLMVAHARSRQMPKLIRDGRQGDGAFEAGRFEGTLVLVEAATGARLCSAPVSATSSPEVTHKSGDFSALEDDFMRRFAAASEAARAAMADPLAPSDPAPAGFSVVLKSPGANRIQVIKLVRDVADLDLRQAKNLVDGAPQTVKSGLSRAEAEALRTRLLEAGAQAEIQ